jgi:hypothetical protein
MMARKGAFAETITDDIDELLAPQVPAPAPETQASSEDTEPTADRDAPTPTAVPRRRRAAVSPPSVQIDNSVHKQLRKLTSKEYAKDPTTARTYAQVVLDAIEAHAPQLSTHWQSASSQPAGGLFSRQKASPPKRRRHTEPPMRIPLAGLNPQDRETMDNLVDEWKAGSRSALVEEALRLYLASN